MAQLVEEAEPLGQNPGAGFGLLGVVVLGGF